MNTKFVIILLLIISPHFSFCQGLTNSSIRGKIVDLKNKGIEGANIIIKNINTQVKTYTISNKKGVFNFRNLNSNGSYSIKITHIGYKNVQFNNLIFNLGNNILNKIILSKKNNFIKEIIISDVKKISNENSSLVINKNNLVNSPNLSDSFTDLLKYNVLANVHNNGGISFLGTNIQYNAIYIDGTINNDIYGLAGNGMIGNLNGSSLISNEALSQVKISLNPYDVSQSNFIGGSINAITQSGTNKIKGTVYYKFKSEDLAGTTQGDLDYDKENKPNEFNSQIGGITIGGPIVKNKLFFFSNIELLKEKIPYFFNLSEYEGKSDIKKINQLVEKLNNMGYNPGTFSDNEVFKSHKILLKLDWIINKQHCLMFRSQYNYGKLDRAPINNYNNLSFSNSDGIIPTLAITNAIELKSKISNTISNNFKLSYTYSKDELNPKSSPFPSITIHDGLGTINIGTNIYFNKNALTQKVFSFTNNINFIKNDHNFTFGTHNEYYNFNDLFVANAWGSYEYTNLDDFLEDKEAKIYSLKYSAEGKESTDLDVDFRAMQLGFYVQDEWQIKNNFKLNTGLRLDIPFFRDNPKEVPNFNNLGINQIEQFYNLNGAKSGKMPTAQLLWSPRIGFNWDIFSNFNSVVSGGVGIYTARAPIVWLSSSFKNNGMLFASVYQNSDYGPSQKFNPNIHTQYKDPIEKPALTKYQGGTLDLYSKDFKYPQFLKTNIALKQTLPFNIKSKFEIIYTKTLQDIIWKDVNMKPSYDNLRGKDNRPLFKTYKNGIIPMFDQIMLGDNTSKGYSYSLLTELSKKFENNLELVFSYCYGESKSVFDGNNDDNAYQWYKLQVGGYSRNNPKLTRSNFSIGHKIITSLNYHKEFFKNSITKINIIYRGQSGSPFSFIYNNKGNLTGEAYGGPELIYIPKKMSEINLVQNGNKTPEEQWIELNNFIKSNKYLAENRGKYAERNGARLPFINKIDLHIAHEILLNKRNNSLEVCIDLYNFTNMLNKDWGIEYYNKNGNYELIEFKGFNSETNMPEYTFTLPNNSHPYYVKDFGTDSSRWQAMFTARYKF